MPKKPRADDRHVRLTAEHVALLDQLEKEERGARRYRKHVDRARELREQLDRVFGEKSSGIMPGLAPGEGRAFLRTAETRHYEPLPAKEVRIVKYHEFPAWDI